MAENLTRNSVAPGQLTLGFFRPDSNVKCKLPAWPEGGALLSFETIMPFVMKRPEPCMEGSEGVTG